MEGKVVMKQMEGKVVRGYKIGKSDGMKNVKMGAEILIS